MSKTSRLGIFLCAIIPSKAQAAAPDITVALYAVEQKEAPLRIIGFKHELHGIQVEVGSNSDKAIVSMRVVTVLLGPAGCPTDNKVGNLISGGSRAPISLGPHAKGVSSNRVPPISLSSLILGAKKMGAGSYVHFQVGVVEVDFADGTVWKRPGGQFDGRPHGPFDRTLLDADRVTCPDATLRKALAGITSIQSPADYHFRELSVPISGQPESVPRLEFRCTIREGTAYCPGPPEADNPTTR